MRMEDEFLLALEQVGRRFQMRVYAYVVMPEHVHVLVSEPESTTLAAALQLLKTKVSVQARKAQKRVASDEPFWQARYFDRNVRHHPLFVTQLRYVHRNPVKRPVQRPRRLAVKVGVGALHPFRRRKRKGWGTEVSAAVFLPDKPEIPLCARHVFEDLGLQRLGIGKLLIVPKPQQKLHLDRRSLADLYRLKIQNVGLHAEPRSFERGPIAYIAGSLKTALLNRQPRHVNPIRRQKPGIGRQIDSRNQQLRSHPAITYRCRSHFKGTPEHPARALHVAVS